MLHEVRQRIRISTKERAQVRARMFFATRHKIAQKTEMRREDYRCVKYLNEDGRRSPVNESCRRPLRQSQCHPHLTRLPRTTERSKRIP